MSAVRFLGGAPILPGDWMRDELIRPSAASIAERRLVTPQQIALRLLEQVLRAEGEGPAHG